jgi:hypothetical protein
MAALGVAYADDPTWLRREFLAVGALRHSCSVFCTKKEANVFLNSTGKRCRLAGLIALTSWLSDALHTATYHKLDFDVAKSLATPDTWQGERRFPLYHAPLNSF